MIADKLHDVDAHILVFAPSASREAGRIAAEEPTDDELWSAERLGYAIAPMALVNELGLGGPIFVKGNLGILKQRWIALLPSRSPGARELNALRSVAAELANRDRDTCVALIHNSRFSEEIAKIFSGHGINTVLLLPFGVLIRKSVSTSAMHEDKLITLISTVPIDTKWSRQTFAKTADALRSRAYSVILSDPEPDWLMGQGSKDWQIGQSSLFATIMFPIIFEQFWFELAQIRLGSASNLGHQT